MSYLKRNQLEEIASEVRDLALTYKSNARGEYPVGRILFGYLVGRFGNTRREVPIYTLNTTKRIDFLVGTEKGGTYIEFVLRHKGSEWYLNTNRDELQKLCRSRGKQRALVIIDVSGKAALPIQRLRDEYKNWKSSPGKYTRRSMCIVYAAERSYSFGVKVSSNKAVITE